MSLAVGPAPRTPSGFDRLPGVTPPGSAEPRAGFLTDTIAELGLADAAHLEAAINESRVRGVPPETLLVDQDQLTDADLARARAEHAALPFVDLDSFERDREAAALIPRDAAERLEVLPIALEGRAVVVALADPLDVPALTELAWLRQREVIPVVAASAAIEERIDELPKHVDVEETPAPPAPPRLQPIEGGATAAPAHHSASPLPDSLTDRIVDRIEAAMDDVARSELLKALDDATAEIEQLSAKLEQTEQRAQALERERDELRAELDG